ncbi:unnamed protein product, partial [Staurois parvus]
MRSSELKMSARSCDQLCPITSMPHISTHLSCLSVSPISASQCHLSMPISATYQCCQSVPPISAISAAYQCASLPPISACQCRLSVPVSAA